MLNQKQNQELQQVLNFTPYENLTEREKVIYMTAARNGYNLGMKHKRQIDRVETILFNKEIINQANAKPKKQYKKINTNRACKTTEAAIDTAKDIVAKTIQHYGVSMEDFVSIKKFNSLVQARSMAINLIKEVLNISLNSVSHFVGNRDHTTIIHHLRMKYEKKHLWEENKRIWEDYQTIKESL